MSLFNITIKSRWRKQRHEAK